MQIQNTVLEILDGTVDVSPTPALSYADIQSHLKLDGSADQTMVEGLISAATKRLEQFIDRKLMTQHWSIYLDCFPRDYKRDGWWDGYKDGAISELYTSNSPIELPFGPCRSISFIRAYDQTDGTTTVDATAYSVDSIGPVGRILLKLGSVWPSLTLRPVNGVHIRGTFGLSGTASTLPSEVKQAIKITVAEFYEKRGDNSSDPKLPVGAQVLLEPYRRWKLK